jgi:RimJ/RimL family protein N-acetyltransferase
MEGMPSKALCEQWTTHVQTRAGVQICIRPLGPDDRDREIAFVNGLSERSRYFRLMTPLKILPRHLVDQLMDIDYARRMAFVATVSTSRGEEFVGVVRYAEATEACVAELAVSVADQWQRTGIARLLVTQLVRFARSRGIHRLTGIVLPENEPMIVLARSLGFTIAFDPAQHLINIACDLSHDRAREPRAGCGEVPVRDAQPHA